MAEILITGVEIPKKGNVGIMIYADGSVEVVGTGKLSRPIYGVPTTKAQELPPHGRLIEENKAYDSIMEQTANHYIDMDGVDLGLQNTPTIVEAST